jgi:hypothetical protein
MAVWALARLAGADRLDECERRWRPGETDATVEAEWAAATGAPAPSRRAIDVNQGQFS